MSFRIGVSPNDKLPPAYQRAANLRHELGRAVGLFGIGDRSGIVLRTLAAGKSAYDSIGDAVPRPVNMDRQTWARILNELKHEYGHRPYESPDEGVDRIALAS